MSGSPARAWQFHSFIGVNPLQTTWPKRGIVSGRVALLPRSAEIQPPFHRFSDWTSPKANHPTHSNTLCMGAARGRLEGRWAAPFKCRRWWARSSKCPRSGSRAPAPPPPAKPFSSAPTIAPRNHDPARTRTESVHESMRRPHRAHSVCRAAAHAAPALAASGAVPPTLRA